MFNKLKDKLKSWIKETKGKLKPQEPEASNEEIQEKKEAEEKPEEKIEKVEEKIKEVEKKIEEAKKEKIPEISAKFEPRKQKHESELEKVKEKTEELKSEKKSVFSKLKTAFKYKISEEDFNNIFENLEMLLLENNVALEVVEDIKSKLSKRLIGKEIKQEELESEIKKELKSTLNEILIEPDDPLDAIKEKKKEGKPFIILFFGINGTGKTTTIAKLANLLQKNNLSVVLAAADTFRAASIEQIQIHADKLKIPLIKHDYGSDPAAVGFDAIRYAEKHKIDVVLIDTAGRMHTKTNLLTEMDKICRVTKPDLKIFVAESIAGNDATQQAFNKPCNSQTYFLPWNRAEL